ncbi:hypothetical protein [Streptomyces sp. NBC_01435]|uniref:hypothetical protein n=1 Tax=Streptomyces sp. NBC_01435 TaxID=2903865 RepID=UPI002E31F960|nr:hypothetical protein [Streptomyces sp. NBC_01435]
MTTRRARRTVRSAALVAVAAAAVLSLTACQSGGNGTAAGSEKAQAGVGTRTVTSAAYRTTAETAETAESAQAKAGSPVRTQTLVDGSKAEIYELGDQHYRVKIINRGSVLATLETKGADAGLDANDMFVVLTLGGEVHSWMGGGHTGPGTFKLAGGWTAKVTKTGELRYRAQIIGHDGSVDATIEANQHDVGLDANGVYIVLSAGGVISSHA